MTAKKAAKKATVKKTAAKKVAAKRVGAPSMYTPALIEKICALIADGASMNSVAKMPGMPSNQTLYKWLGDADKAEFAEMYARARDLRADKLVEEALAIGDALDAAQYGAEDGGTKIDSGMVAAAKLKIETRKWFAARVAPRKWGDKVQVGQAEDLQPVMPADDLSAAARLSGLLALAAARAAAEDGGEGEG